MTLLTLLFWIALLLPGYAFARLVIPENVREGLPGVIAVSMLASFALLSPVNIIGHTVEAPLWIFSATIIILIIASLVLITMHRWWRDLRTLLFAAFSIELAVVVIDLILNARAGSFMIGDAVIHLSRISLITNDGLTNGHPFFGGNFFFPTYHTNILHAVMASCAQLTPVDHLATWWAARPVGTMLVVGGMYYLTWTIFQRHWPAWAASLFILGMHGSLPFLIYPNQLAPLWIMPILLAFIIEAARNPTDWRHIAKTAVASLVLGQMHGLYTLFAVLLFVPVLAAFVIAHLARRRPRQALLVGACCAALAPGLAFPLVSVAHTNVIGNRLAALEDDSNAAMSAAAESSTETAALAHRFGVGFSRYTWRPLVLAAMLIVLFMLMKDLRREFLVLFGVCLVAAALLWLPFCYQLLHQLLREEWIIARIEFILRIVFAAVAAGGAAALLQTWFERSATDARTLRWRMAPWRIAALGLIPLGALSFGGNAQYSWPKYLQQATAPQSAHVRNLAWMHTLQSFVRQNIEPNSRVLCPRALGMLLTAVHDCRIVIGATNNLGVPNEQERLEDQRQLLSDYTSEPTRKQLLDEYDVRYVVFIGERRQWALRAAEAMYQRQIPAVQWNLSIIELPDDHAPVQR